MLVIDVEIVYRFGALVRQQQGWIYASAVKNIAHGLLCVCVCVVVFVCVWLFLCVGVCVCVCVLCV
jgi:hypothetical protein